MTQQDLEFLLTKVPAERTSRTIDLMREKGVDHLLLGTSDNIRYTTNYRSLIIHETADHMLCIMDSSGQADIYGPHLRDPMKNSDPTTPTVNWIRPLSGWVPAMVEPRTTVQAMAAGLKDAKVVGYDAIHPELLDGLKSEMTSTRFVYFGTEIMNVRRVKLADEIRLMEQAATDNFAALNSALQVAAPGITDKELLATSLLNQQLSTAELITHSTCNVDSVFGNWFPTNNVIKRGQAIFVDQVYYGRGGYASDLTRTVFVGEPPAPVLKAYEKLVEISQEVHGVARAGALPSVLDDLLNESLRRNGLAPSPYGLGHGIGLRVMEAPSLTQRDLIDSDLPLRAGEVVALEPETAVEYQGKQIALKVEDCFLVEESGLRPLGPPAGVKDVVLDV